MKLDIIVFSQYRENYGTVESPYWKPKGGHTMLVSLDNDDMVYYSEDVVRVLTDICERKSNPMCRYEYVSHDIVFGGLEVIPQSEFESVFQEGVL